MQILRDISSKLSARQPKDYVPKNK